MVSPIGVTRGRRIEGVLRRPPHLATRQFTGRAFSEAATLIRVAGSRNEYGEHTETETSTEIKCVTAAVSGIDEERRRVLSEAGVQLDAGRLFWLALTAEPVSATGNGDIIVYGGERWRVSEVQRWGDFAEVLAVRQEPQPVP